MIDHPDQFDVIAQRFVVETEMSLARSSLTLAQVHEEMRDHKLRVNLAQGVIDGERLCGICAGFAVKKPDSQFSYRCCDQCVALVDQTAALAEIPGCAPVKVSHSGDDETLDWLESFDDHPVLHGITAWYQEPELLSKWRDRVIQFRAAHHGWKEWPDVPAALWQELPLTEPAYSARWYIECLWEFAPEFVLDFPVLLSIEFHLQALVSDFEENLNA